MPQRPKRIDAKTMHELIALGAENQKGPWLCLKCGIDGRPISIPSYKSFRNHLIAVHKEKIDARLCEECGHRSSNRLELQYHALCQHDIQPPKDVKFPSCSTCGFVALSPVLLQTHAAEQHNKIEPIPKTIQQCSYCDKVFLKETTLSTHIKTYHREQALLDGLIEENFTSTIDNSRGIKVLSNITLPPTKSLQSLMFPQGTHQGVTQIEGKSQQAVLLQQPTLEPSSEAEAMSNVASGITTSLTLVGTTDMMDEDQYMNVASASNQAVVDNEFLAAAAGDPAARIVTADGSELQLSAAQKEEILSQLQGNGDGTGNVIMVLNHESYDEQPTIVSTATVVPTSNPIMVVYSQANVVASEVEPIPTVSSVVATPPLSASTFDETALMNEVKEEAPTDPVHIPTLDKEPTIDQDDDDVEKADGDDAEKAKQSLISTLQGDWSDDEEDDNLMDNESDAQKLLPTPALFEDLAKKEDDADTKITDAVDDLLSELEGEYKEKEKKQTLEEKTLLSMEEIEGPKDETEKEDKGETASTDKEFVRLVDEWDDDL